MSASGGPPLPPQAGATTRALHPALTDIDRIAAADPDRAFAILVELSRRGDPRALFILADSYWRGALVEQNYSQGRHLFGLASQVGDPMGRRAYTNLLASGIAGPADWPLAIARLREEARDDSRRAQMLALIEGMALTADGSPATLPPTRRLSEHPDVRYVADALTAGECAFLRLVSEPIYEPSLISEQDRQIALRTSDGATMHWLIEDPVVHAINRRLAALTGTDVHQGEPLQILRYRPGQEYRPHLDWLGNQPGSRRILTALIYLNDEYEGGETEFVEIGLTVKGRRGDVLIFRNEGADGRVDPLTKHAGLPVVRGTKYLATRWIRDLRHSA